MMKEWSRYRIFLVNEIEIRSNRAPIQLRILLSKLDKRIKANAAPMNIRPTVIPTNFIHAGRAKVTDIIDRSVSKNRTSNIFSTTMVARITLLLRPSRFPRM